MGPIRGTPFILGWSLTATGQAKGPRTKLCFLAPNKIYFIKLWKTKPSNEEHLVRETLIIKSFYTLNSVFLFLSRSVLCLIFN